MKNKIKQIGSLSILLALAMPVVVFGASLDITAGGSTGLPQNTLAEIVKNIMNWLLTMIGVIAVIGFAIAGVLYLTAAGDDDRIKTAKKAMIFSIIGVLVAIAGLVALKVAQGLLSGSGNNF